MSVTWKIDPAHSEIQFKVRHLMITTVTGRFRKFESDVVTETGDFITTKQIRFTAEIDSIDTNSEQRDTHLKSPDFFDAAHYGQLSFVSTRYETLGDEATLQGDLTIRGITRPITLDVEFSGTVIDPIGQIKAGFILDGKISRKEFGLLWNVVTEAGGVVASDEIRIHGEVEYIRQAT